MREGHRNIKTKEREKHTHTPKHKKQSERERDIVRMTFSERIHIKMLNYKLTLKPVLRPLLLIG